MKALRGVGVSPVGVAGEEPGLPPTRKPAKEYCYQRLANQNFLMKYYTASFHNM